MRPTAALSRQAPRDRVTLFHGSLDEPWPATQFDLVVLSEIGYYLEAAELRTVLSREVARLVRGTVVIAAHWRHRGRGLPDHGGPRQRHHRRYAWSAPTGRLP